MLATAWALFSGPTRYISLATVAFFGIGAYTVGVLGEMLPWPAVLAAAALVGTIIALIVGLSTLRLSGIYFVIFSFGLAELVRQLVTWYEANIHRSVGRYIFLDVTQPLIYWQLLALAVAVLLTGWLIGRSRLGLALRVIGEDELVARHCGIDTTGAKLTLFALSALFTTLAGAIMAPRWTYIDPAIAFNPIVSFQVVIMALLGGVGAPVRTAARRRSAGAPVRAPVGQLPELLPDPARRRVHDHRLPGAGRRGRAPVERDGTRSRRSAAPRRRHERGARGRRGLRKAFGGLVAVDDMAFSVAPGEIVGLIGPNGSGKTTVLNLISGALRSDAGDIRHKGETIVGVPTHRIARRGIARTFQLVRVLSGMTAAART